MQLPRPISVKSASHATGRRTILVVDDEKMVREVAGAILRGGGYEVLLAESGEAAIRIAREYAHRISLVLLDPGLPGLSAKRTFAELVAVRPDLALVVSSGSLADDALLSFDRNRVSDFVPKPYTATRLRAAVDCALASHPLAA